MFPFGNYLAQIPCTFVWILFVRYFLWPFLFRCFVGVRMIKTFEIYRLFRNGKSLMMIVVSLSCFFLNLFFLRNLSLTLIHSLSLSLAPSLVITFLSTPRIRKFLSRTPIVCTNCTFFSKKINKLFSIRFWDFCFPMLNVISKWVFVCVFAHFMCYRC